MPSVSSSEGLRSWCVGEKRLSWPRASRRGIRATKTCTTADCKCPTMKWYERLQRHLALLRWNSGREARPPCHDGVGKPCMLPYSANLGRRHPRADPPPRAPRSTTEHRPEVAPYALMRCNVRPQSQAVNQPTSIPSSSPSSPSPSPPSAPTPSLPTLLFLLAPPRPQLTLPLP